MERTLKALANKRRLAIISLLYKKGKKNVGQIAESIRLSFRSTSRHLSVLANADILEKEQKSKQSFYSIHQNTHELIEHILKILT